MFLNVGLKGMKLKDAFRSEKNFVFMNDLDIFFHILLLKYYEAKCLHNQRMDAKG